MKYLLPVLAIAGLVSAKSVVQTLNSPDFDISGLAWGDNELWAMDATSRNVYRLDPATGDIISQFYFDYTETMNPTGLAYNRSYDRVLCGGWLGSSGWVYQYTPEGEYIFKSLMCGG